MEVKEEEKEFQTNQIIVNINLHWVKWNTNKPTPSSNNMNKNESQNDCHNDVFIINENNPTNHQKYNI